MLQPDLRIALGGRHQAMHRCKMLAQHRRWQACLAQQVTPDFGLHNIGSGHKAQHDGDTIASKSPGVNNANPMHDARLFGRPINPPHAPCSG
ncbi:hypothetical protein SDC9_98287 [bioreactor metagenome]|uniref:Uncharacterized protein n=1 Tax=bioreactor metagenome TaxID=1076179 RepID=A0A645AFP4_9ZZZZ